MLQEKYTKAQQLIWRREHHADNHYCSLSTGMCSRNNVLQVFPQQHMSASVNMACIHWLFITEKLDVFSFSNCRKRLIVK